MEYILMAIVQESGWGSLTKAQQEQGMAGLYGVYRGTCEGWRPQDEQATGTEFGATTVRMTSVSRRCWMGPMRIEEQLGGYYIIDVPT